MWPTWEPGSSQTHGVRVDAAECPSELGVFRGQEWPMIGGICLHL